MNIERESKLLKTRKVKIMKALVKNVPTYAVDYPFWVVSEVNGELWFYGAYADRDEANNIAYRLKKIMVVD